MDIIAYGTRWEFVAEGTLCARCTDLCEKRTALKGKYSVRGNDSSIDDCLKNKIKFAAI